nr:Ig-like domain-containing protein [Armatimonadota bacterium]
MIIQKRRSRGVAAASMVTVSLFPLCAASAADVEVSIRNHTPQDVIEGPNVAIEAEFKSSTGHSIQRVEFLVDGQVVESKTLDQPSAQGTFIFAWDTTEITNDVHTVTTRAYDEQNHIGTSNLQLFVDNQKVDKAEPMLRVTVPREGAIVSGQFNIHVQGQQRAAGEPIPYVIVKLDNDIVGWFNGQSSASFRYDGTVLKDGAHKVQAATRTASNQEILSPPIIVIVNKGGGDTTNYGSNPPPIDPTVDPILNPTPNPIAQPSPQIKTTPLQPIGGNTGTQTPLNHDKIRDMAYGAGNVNDGSTNGSTFSSSSRNSGGQVPVIGPSGITTPA